MSEHRAARPSRRLRHPTGDNRRRRFHTTVRVLLSAGLVLGMGSAGTFAFWTDEVTVTGITITAGTIDLQVNDLDTVTGYTSLNITNMVPGNSVAAVLTVKNAGTASLKYTATSTASNSLGSALTLKVTGNSSVTGSSPSATCAGSALSGTGTSLNGSMIGTGRLLTASQSEPICVQLTLPSDAASSLQGTSTSVSLAFTGTSDLS